MVSRSPLAVLMLQLPAERIIAASTAAGALLAEPGEQVVGRTLSEFADGAPTESKDLLAGGRLNGYQTAWSLSPVRGGTPLTMWIRAIGAQSRPAYVVALLFEPHERSATAGASSATPVAVVEAATVVGTTNDQLVIDRIGENVDQLLGDRAAEVIGRSLLRLAHPADLAGLLSALAEATASGRGVTLSLRVLRTGLDALPCQLTLLPLSPAPACIFALERDDSDAADDAVTTDGAVTADGAVTTDEAITTDTAKNATETEVTRTGVSPTALGDGTGPAYSRPAPASSDTPATDGAATLTEDETSADLGVSAVQLERMLSSLRHGVEAVHDPGELAELDPARIPGLNELTSREFDIVTRLLAGDRAPAIAEALFIGKSTVRNHLSSVFAKLGVRSQQELIVLLRRTELPPMDS